MREESAESPLPGARLFEAQRFHDAHEAWEAVWRGASGQRRELFQGLVQVAAACHHLQLGRRRQAGTLLRRARRHLLAAGKVHVGIDTDRLMVDLDRLESWLGEAPEGTVPPWPGIHVS